MQCQICKSEMRTIPAGTSKATGKPYKAFEACPNRCKQPYAGAPRPAEQNGWQVVVEHLTALEAKTDEMINLIKEQLAL